MLGAARIRWESDGRSWGMRSSSPPGLLPLCARGLGSAFFHHRIVSVEAPVEYTVQLGSARTVEELHCGPWFLVEMNLPETIFACRMFGETSVFVAVSERKYLVSTLSSKMSDNEDTRSLFWGTPKSLELSTCHSTQYPSSTSVETMVFESSSVIMR